jgi:uncharacterized protein with HEPN domain
MDSHSDFTLAQVPWRSMRGMRNRITHGYFDINLEVVCETVRTALPALLEKLSVARQRADSDNDINDELKP